MDKRNRKRDIKVTRVQERKATEQERKIGRALIALARVQLAGEAEELADAVAEAAAHEHQARKQIVRERRAERAERRQETDETEPPAGGAV